MLPFVAIIGRPNVGKSSLFNTLVGHPISIVDPRAGVTRDRILHDVHRNDCSFTLVDTGGIGIVDEAKLEQDVNLQIDRAIETSDHILFVCDARDGLKHTDKEIAKRLRPHKERVSLVINKVDYEGLEANIHEFNRLGLGEPIAISAEQIVGIHELVDTLAERLPSITDDYPRQDYQDHLRICFAGRRNVGKSSLTNALCGEERVIVADLAGTTRDAVDVPLKTEAGNFLLIDTAGLRKKKQLNEDLEFYAACRTERGIIRSDVVMLVIDASDEIGVVDKKLAHFCAVEGKPTIVVINKWDLAEQGGAKEDDYKEWLFDRLPGLRFAPCLFTCALNGLNVPRVLALAKELNEENKQRVNTSELNKILEAAVQRRRPRKIGSSYTKIYYATQGETCPPTFTIFVNRTDWVEPGYSRYLENYFRKHLTFNRVPYRIIFKARKSQFHENKDVRERTMVGTKAERKSHLIVPKKAKTKTGGQGKGGFKKPGRKPKKPRRS